MPSTYDTVARLKMTADPRRQFELPPYFRSHEAMVGWCTLFLTIVSKEPPENSLMEDLDDREQNNWWKCKKWSYMNLNRTFVR